MLTQTGYQAIRDLTSGKDQVWSRNAQTGVMAWKAIEAQYSNPYPSQVTVTLKHRGTGQQQQIISNRIHPYFVQLPADVTQAVPNSEGHDYQGVIERGAWVDAQHLQAGYRLLNADNSWAEVVGVSISHEPLVAYNLTVADYHTYFVAGAMGAPAVWVHNDCQKYLDADDLDSSSHLRPEEIETAKRLNQQEHFEVKGLPNQADGDFIAADGTTFDAMGMPNAYKYWGSGQDFLNSLNIHLNKAVDHVVIDLTGSNAGQRKQILDYLANHTKKDKVNKVIFVGD